MPWRVGKKSPKKLYYRLLSEFMLQQTQVKTVIPYFENFTSKIPDLISLSKVRDAKLMKCWEGLGYYSRAKNLKKTAKIIINEFKGKLPNNEEGLKSLPGIGDYTAKAIMAIAFNNKIIPLDGNVERVFSRFYAVEKPIEKSKIFIKNIAEKHLPDNRHGDYAQALMELGALICKPTNPICNECPISKNCKSYKKKDFNLIKITKKNIEKYFILKVYKKNQSYLLIKNTKFNFLKNLSIFPMEELSNPKNFNENLNFKMSNMNMNIKIQYLKFNQKFPSSYWIDKKKLDSYMLPSFTKKVVQYLEKN